ncbi:MAG: [LysW]-lysine hydrolase [Phycisphaerae bacterium]
MTTRREPASCIPPTDDDAIAMLEAMLRIRSESRDESRLASFLVDRMGAFGLGASMDEVGNAVGVTRVADATPSAEIVLLGHMDTVPGVVPVRREEDLLYGRGAVDAKGPLAAFVVAAATVEMPPGVRVVVIGAVEEESATSRGARFVATRPRPAACIIGEPSGWEAVTLGYKGRLVVSLELVRGSAHTAGAHGGVADLVHAWWTDVLTRIDALNAGRPGIFHSIQARLRALNTRSDGLHDVALVEAGFRLPPGATPNRIEDVCREAAIATCPDASLRFSGAEVAHAGDRRNGLVRAFTNAIRDAGGTPAMKLKTGTSDMNVVAPAWGCPIVAYGAGDSSLDHTPDEHVCVLEYLRSIRVLRTTLEQIATDLATTGGFS